MFGKNLVKYEEDEILEFKKELEYELNRLNEALEIKKKLRKPYRYEIESNTRTIEGGYVKPEPANKKYESYINKKRVGTSLIFGGKKYQYIGENEELIESICFTGGNRGIKKYQQLEGILEGKLEGSYKGKIENAIKIALEIIDEDGIENISKLDRYRHWIEDIQLLEQKFDDSGGRVFDIIKDIELNHLNIYIQNNKYVVELKDK